MNNGNLLKPIAIIDSKIEFQQFLNLNNLKFIKDFETKMLDEYSDGCFGVKGFCIPCNKDVSFIVDMQFGGYQIGKNSIPNWRERLECPICSMNNRQRLIASLVKQLLFNQTGKSLYFMEQVTPIYRWAINNLNEHEVFGSEYLGYEISGGEIVDGIRHEDIERLSFLDTSFDLIVSNDVFEHVPNPLTAFKECYRVLKTGGTMLTTIPFHNGSDKSIVRAEIIDSQLYNILPAVYHGNPVSKDGALVFTDFGWDIFDQFYNAGFSNVSLDIYASETFGHLGGGQIIFKIVK